MLCEKDGDVRLMIEDGEERKKVRNKLCLETPIDYGKDKSMDGRYRAECLYRLQQLREKTSHVSLPLSSSPSSIINPYHI